MNVVDQLAASGTIVHALILIDGRCTGSAPQLEQIQFQLIRAFGRVLGLAWSQANDTVLSEDGTPSYQQLQGWPLMRPIDLMAEFSLQYGGRERLWANEAFRQSGLALPADEERA